jgi:hypothetical protein
MLQAQMPAIWQIYLRCYKPRMISTTQQLLTMKGISLSALGKVSLRGSAN